MVWLLCLLMFWRDAEVLTKKPWISRDEQLFEEFVRHVDLSKVSPHKAVQQRFFNQLRDLWTDNQGSLRYATSHMLDRFDHVCLLWSIHPFQFISQSFSNALQLRVPH
jgi:hypothetical protein